MARLGDMKERVTIQQASEVADTQGGAAVTWSTLATVWAAIRPWHRAGSEHEQAGTVGSHADYEVEIDYRTDVTPAMRIAWTPFRTTTAKTLRIVEVQHKDLRLHRLLLQCAEVI